MVYVITGGPGFGKTILIDELHKLGYRTGSEVARQIIAAQIAEGGDKLPWMDSVGFEKMVMKDRIYFLQQTDIKCIAFSDRGLPDQAAFSWYKGKEISEPLSVSLIENRYAKKVFVTPPWREIYRKDQIRKETYEEAVKIHDFVVKAYLEFDYELIDLPRVSPDERIKFILKSL